MHEMSMTMHCTSAARTTHLEHSGDVAGAEDGVHVGVPPRLRRREVGREDAVGGAPPPEVLARGAPPRRSRTAAAAVRMMMVHFHTAAARPCGHENLVEITRDLGVRCC
jgi:hypothetical protein